MGEVYQVTDTNLARQVAIKVLPASVAGDAERLARFDREAKTLAALNHPNIAQIHGLEKGDGTIALVMELVEGPTLADRIAQGAIPVDEALPVAKQIAEALEAAHEQGIIHRDLKPANVKVRPDGTVKVLDFGLAKALEPTGSMSPEFSQSPTITTPAMTQAGMILGTAAYMSPEQAKGRTVDKRSDVWAFGAVLHEMLTGRRAFEGEDVSDTMASVLKADTKWDVFPDSVSPTVVNVIRRCLQRDRSERARDIGDVRLALECAFETSVSQAVDSAVVPQPAGWRRALPVAVALVVGGLVTGLVGWSVWPATEPRLVNQFAYAVPDDQLFRNTGRSVMALAPDGRSFVYNTTDGLYLRTMGELEARLIPGTEDGSVHPFFSPDGQSVAYYTSNELRRIGISGGAPVVITEVDDILNGATWGPDGTILFGQADGIYRVPATGGTPTLVIANEDGRPDGAQLLPDGDTVLFSVMPGGSWDDAQIVAQSLSSGERTIVLEGGNDARYLPTGHLVYALGDGLFGIAFDADTLSVTGGAVPLAQGVSRATDTAGANYGVSDDGTLAYLSGGVTGIQRSFVWVDRDGREEPVAADPANYQEFTLSPDGTRVAVRILGDGNAVWIYDLVRDTSTRLTFESDDVGTLVPTWTPDGTRVAFGPPLSWKRADGIGAVEGLDDATGRVPHAFSPDGTTLVFEERNAPGSSVGLGVLTLEGDRTATLVIDGEFDERNPALSPDGWWVAYNSDETGEPQVYVRPFPDVDSGRWQISTDGGRWPVWNPAGGELFYRGPTGVMALAFEAEPTFTPGALTQLFEWNYSGGLGNRRMAVSPDGQRFLLLADATETADGEATPPQIVVVQNWFEELRRLVPTN